MNATSSLIEQLVHGRFSFVLIMELLLRKNQLLQSEFQFLKSVFVYFDLAASIHLMFLVIAKTVLRHFVLLIAFFYILNHNLLYIGE